MNCPFIAFEKIIIQEKSCAPESSARRLSLANFSSWRISVAGEFLRRYRRLISCAPSVREAAVAGEFQWLHHWLISCTPPAHLRCITIFSNNINGQPQGF
jgi:hypothetical protein